MWPKARSRSGSHQLQQFLGAFTSVLFGVSSIAAIIIQDSVYYDINIEISHDVPVENCRQVFINLEKTLTGAANTLYNALDGRLRFGSFNIFLPQSMPESCIPASNETRQKRATITNAAKVDIFLTGTHTVFGLNPWTKQYGDCGTIGRAIYFPYQALESPNSEIIFVKEWAKYRYGVFDDIGFIGDPVYPFCNREEARKVPNICSDIEKIDNEGRLENGSAVTSIFCNTKNHNRYAPTKQNYICNRRSILEIILQHPDLRFQSTWNMVDDTNFSSKVDTKPLYYYKRRRPITRYVVLIDDSLEISQRETWSFLRSAFRKWVIYDLPASSEVGVILVSGRILGKVIELTPLNNNTNRDLVASFLPYTTTDTRQLACLDCAIDKALKMFEKCDGSDGSNVILIISPGMDPATNVTNIVQKINGRAQLVGINYPNLFTPRKPLDELTEATHQRGVSYTLLEKKFNSEKSLITTYVQLANILMNIARHFYSGSKEEELPIEIHRQEIYDSFSDKNMNIKQNTRLTSGQFNLEQGLGLPAGFYIYTHSVEMPLIQSFELISPTGIIYNSRSDQRLPIKQLSLICSLNETGLWKYNIERYAGNPQPHVVQVIATPTRFGGSSRPIVNINTWGERYGYGQEIFFTLYCEVSHSEERMYPVREASVEALLTYHDTINNTEIRERYILKDTGTGGADITMGDGIYSKNIRNLGPGVYYFEIFVKSIPNQTYTVTSEKSPDDDENNFPIQRCCGSSYGREIDPKLLVESAPFERYGTIVSFHIDAAEYCNISSTTLEETRRAANAERVSDFTCNQFGTILNFTWTSSEMLILPGRDINTASYDIKYSTSLVEIIDDFESAQLIAEHDLTLPNETGTIISYIHNVSQSPEMYDQLLYFAVRLKRSPSHYSPISNIVDIYIKSIPKPVLPPLIDSIDHDITTVDPKLSSTADTSVDSFDIKKSQPLISNYYIPLLVILLLILLLLTCWLIYYMHAKRIRASKEKDSVPNDRSIENISPQDHSGHSEDHKINNINSNNSEYLIVANRPDHLTLGIPFYDDELLAKKRYSSCGSYGGYSTKDLYTLNSNDIDTHRHLSPPHNNSICYLTQAHTAPPVPPLPTPLQYHQTTIHEGSTHIPCTSPYSSTQYTTNAILNLNSTVYERSMNAQEFFIEQDLHQTQQDTWQPLENSSCSAHEPKDLTLTSISEQRRRNVTIV